MAVAKKRAKAQIGATQVNASDIRGLRYAWRNRELVLFLGAGVSIPYGLPSWKSLVLELLLEQVQSTRRLGHVWPRYRRVIAAWMTDYFDYDPLVLARNVERDLRAKDPGDGETIFLGRLRAHMYANYREPAGRTALTAVADLIARPDNGIASVVTFNFDDLLEAELARRKVRVLTISGEERQNGGGLRVIHPHGYVPRQGPITRDNIVFTEPDYHRLTESIFHWGLSEIVESLRKSTVLFIGLSMSDPSLRRLLDASRNSKIPPHWQIQRRHAVPAADMPLVIADVERRATESSRIFPDTEDERRQPEEVAAAIRAALAQADTYDREVFETMGVKTIWVDNFDAVPDIIDAIAQ